MSVHTRVNENLNDKHIHQEEQRRLNRTLKEIASQLTQAREITDGRLSQVISTRTEMWQNAPKVIRDFDDAVVFNQIRQVLEQQEREYGISKQIIPRLERLKQSAYFGRIDFRPKDQSDTSAIYIGTTSLVERSSGQHLIYDWRAPISSLFYDNEPGPAQFEAAGEAIEGSLLLKRQYKVEGDTIVYLFDTDLKIDDDMLQSILGRTAEPRMRTIVQSIQREQNRAIRDEHHDLLIVLGPAGSGKTSIALHRVAYILYRDRGRIDSEGIVIVSPNEIFGDYISRVLPDLGEENTPQMTFSNLAMAQLHTLTTERPLTVETPDHQLEYLFSTNNFSNEDSPARATDAYGTRKVEIAFKGSYGFYKALCAHINKLTTGTSIPFASVTWNGREIVSRDDLRTLLTETYNYLPFRNRLEKIARRISFLMEPIEEQRLNEVQQALIDDPDEPHMNKRELIARARSIVADETADIKSKVKQMTTFDTLHSYASLFHNADALWTALDDKHQTLFSKKDVQSMCQSTVARIRAGNITAEDVAPLLAFFALLGDVKGYDQVKHVVIDEAQDYTALHFEALRSMFPKATFTLVGDPDQSIHPVQPELDWNVVPSILGAKRSQTVSLLTSYRQTEQLAKFARGILPREGIHIIDRPGEKPRVLFMRERKENQPGNSADNKQRAARIALDEIGRWRDEGFELIAIICKTTAESERVYAALHAQMKKKDHTNQPNKYNFPVTLATAEDDTMEPGVVVIPAYLAKGLEFDAVLIPDVGKDMYTDESERKLFYTACTRALHRLTLIASGEPSPLLEMIDPELYVSVGDIQ